MKYTIKDLKEYINKIPDDYEIWLEWVETMLCHYALLNN